jgi:hypothetical protein
MKEIGKRIWNEPAVAIGLLTTLALLVINFISNDHWSVDHIIAILAPLVSALGIRQAVIPTAKLDELTKPPEGTTFRKPTKV